MLRNKPASPGGTPGRIQQSAWFSLLTIHGGQAVCSYTLTLPARPAQGWIHEHAEEARKHLCKYMIYVGAGAAAGACWALCLSCPCSVVEASCIHTPSCIHSIRLGTRCLHRYPTSYHHPLTWTKRYSGSRMTQDLYRLIPWMGVPIHALFTRYTALVGALV